MLVIRTGEIGLEQKKFLRRTEPRSCTSVTILQLSKFNRLIKNFLETAASLNGDSVPSPTYAPSLASIILRNVKTNVMLETFYLCHKL